MSRSAAAPSSTALAGVGPDIQSSVQGQQSSLDNTAVHTPASSTAGSEKDQDVSRLNHNNVNNTTADLPHAKNQDSIVVNERSAGQIDTGDTHMYIRDEVDVQAAKEEFADLEKKMSRKGSLYRQQSRASSKGTKEPAFDAEKGGDVGEEFDLLDFLVSSAIPPF